MRALGRLFNYIHVADNVYIRLDAGTAVSFLCYLTGGAGETYTLTEAKTAGGGSAQVLAAITQWYSCTGDGTDAWVVRPTTGPQAAASTFVAAAAASQNANYLSIDAAKLSDGFKYLKLASTGAGLVTAMVHDLVAQRTPQNLPILGV